MPDRAGAAGALLGLHLDQQRLLLDLMQRLTLVRTTSILLLVQLMLSEAQRLHGDAATSPGRVLLLIGKSLLSRRRHSHHWTHALRI